MKTVLQVIAVVFGLSLLVAGSVWVYDWVTTPLRVTSVQHVEHEWDFAYSRIESLKSTAQMVCDAEKAVINATDDNTKNQRETQLIALKNNYNRQVADYNQELENKFKAGFVAPPDVPRTAPSLTAMKLQVCTQ